MTAKLDSKATPRWKLFLRRAIQPTPFWRKRLDEQVGERDTEFSDAIDQVVANISGVFSKFIISVCVLTLVLLASQWLFFSQDFLQYGLADSIGRGLAEVCASTGNCDIRYLLAGSALAVPMLVAACFMLAGAFHWGTVEEDEAEVSEAELYDAVNMLDERIVRLRADMVLAGLLPLSPEEREEDGD